MIDYEGSRAVQVFCVHRLQQPRYVVGEETPAQVGGLPYARHFMQRTWLGTQPHQTGILRTDRHTARWSDS